MLVGKIKIYLHDEKEQTINYVENSFRLESQVFDYLNSKLKDLTIKPDYLFPEQEGRVQYYIQPYYYFGTYKLVLEEANDK